MPHRKVFSIFEGEGGFRSFMGQSIKKAVLPCSDFSLLWNSSGLITSHVSINILVGKGRISPGFWKSR